MSFLLRCILELVWNLEYKLVCNCGMKDVQLRPAAPHLAPEASWDWLQPPHERKWKEDPQHVSSSVDRRVGLTWPVWPVTTGSFFIGIVFKEVQTKTHQPFCWLDSPVDNRQTLLPHVVAEVFLAPAGVSWFAGVVTVQSSFLWEPEVGKLGVGPTREAI